jgi:hypothetical protein
MDNETMGYDGQEVYQPAERLTLSRHASPAVILGLDPMGAKLTAQTPAFRIIGQTAITARAHPRSSAVESCFT